MCSLLKSKLNEMVLEAEKLFGNRDLSYTLLGVECWGTGQHIFHADPEANKQILVRLPSLAEQDVEQCLYMLSHEAFHCLGPKRNIPVTRLEEGLATYFAKHYMSMHCHSNDWHSHGENYREAMANTEALLAIDPEIIKKARVLQQTTSLITKEILVQELASPAPDDLLDRLMQNFT